MGQKAMIAANALPMLEAEARQRQSRSGGAVPARLPEAEKGEAREKAAEMIGVSARYVSDAKKLNLQPLQVGEPQES